MNILTIDCSKAAPRHSSNERAIRESINALLLAMNEQSVSATFFIHRSFHESYPELVKEINGENHDIGYLSDQYNNIDDFEDSLKSNITQLKELTGSNIRSFKLAGTSLTSELTWIYPVLVRHGFTASNSVMNHTVIKNPALVNQIQKGASTDKHSTNYIQDKPSINSAQDKHSPNTGQTRRTFIRQNPSNEHAYTGLSIHKIDHNPFVAETTFGNIIEHPMSHYKIFGINTYPFSPRNLKHLPYFIHNFILHHSRNNIISLSLSDIPSIIQPLKKLTAKHLFQTLQQSADVNSHLDIPRLDLRTRMVKS